MTGTASPRKCLVFDLDDTLWDGVCLYGQVRVREEVRRAIRDLDGRGILFSIASRGEPEVSFATLRESGLERFFLVPRVNWLPKTTNLVGISRDLGLPLDALAFIDDDPFEREQVRTLLPDVLVLDAACAGNLAGLAEFQPEQPSGDARRRRELYRTELARRDEEGRASDRRGFLLSCAMELTVRAASGGDRDRILELSTRTHQLNTTGLVFGARDVERALAFDPPEILVADLEDRFGTYGTVGVALLREECGHAQIDSFAMSCRVLGRGVEQAFLGALVSVATGRGLSRVRVRVFDTGRNRAMRALVQMAGFTPATTGGRASPGFYDRSLAEPLGGPEWVRVRCASC